MKEDTGPTVRSETTGRYNGVPLKEGDVILDSRWLGHDQWAILIAPRDFINPVLLPVQPSGPLPDRPVSVPVLKETETEQ